MASDINEKLRTEVAQRAGQRCEHCLIHENDAGFPHQVDHILSRKHGGSFTSDNLAYACVVCNRHKGSDVASIDPRTGEIVPLFNPRMVMAEPRTARYVTERVEFEPTCPSGVAFADSGRCSWTP